MINRQLPPEIHPLSNFSLLPLNTKVLENQIPIYYLINPSLDVFRIEFIFEAGSYYGKNHADSFFVSKMLSSGTSQKTSAQISNYIDALGGFLEINHNQSRLQVVLHGLSKYFDDYLSILVELMFDSVFPEDELEIIKNVSIQSYLVSKEKTATISNEIFKKKLFGIDHSFGMSINEEEIAKINQKDLLDFYKKYIKNSAYKVFLCGNVTNDQISLLAKSLENDEKATNNEIIISSTFLEPINVYINKESSLQTTIRVGKRMFNRSHPDFYKFLVFNTILGGYFGSRLMKNIREDKGFTYGISSSLVPLADDGYFMIGSDVKKENYLETLGEINKELADLRDNLVDSSELDLVKNYISGSIFGSVNTVFDLMDKHKSMIFEELDLNFYEELLPNISQVTAEDVLLMANKYMKNLSFVSVG